MQQRNEAKRGPGAIPLRRPLALEGPRVTTRAAADGASLPVVVSPELPGVDAPAWAADNLSELRHLLDRGAVLLRGFDLAGAPGLERLVNAVSGGAMSYTYRSTPRHTVEGLVYTSTDYPANQTIPLHNEMSYTRTWPRKIFFFCTQPAVQGGETPVARSDRVYERIDARIRSRFEASGVLYVRNFGRGLDLSWETVFQTSSQEEVEAYCRKAGMTCEWRPHGLRTRQLCQAAVDHPVTGKRVWFNQAHLFHVSSLPASVREGLQEQFEPMDLPRTCFYGDGAPIEDSVIEEIRRAYDEETVPVEWQRGDVLIVDNIKVAHGRRPFAGPRTVLVAMSEPWSEPAHAEGNG
jgi:alpha-ketoglutarate-dependent taurine dioxygenase